MLLSLDSLSPVILASTSPRRRELLASLGIIFQVIPPLVDEEAFDTDGLSPSEMVLALAKAKAESVAVHQPETVVIGSDTIVVVDGDVLGKPKNREEAFEMLSRLQGRHHDVYSGIAVALGDQVELDYLATRVWMKPMSPAEIEAYIDTGEPMDKAGAYAIQGFGSLIVQRIEGCYFNVVGMSLHLLGELMNRMGSKLPTA